MIERRRAGARSRPLRAFAVAFALCFAAMALWSLATPLFGAPDEPVHVEKAAAVVRGELVGRLVGGASNPLAVVTVPAFYAEIRNEPTCFHTHPKVPASCASLPAPSAKPEPVLIYTARYPPLYYALVGLPSLLGEGRLELYLMRLVSAALASAFVALAFACAAASSRSRLLVPALVVALTPMVLFLGGVVNPSSFEIAAALCAWTSGALLVLERHEAPPRALVAAFAVSACAFELARAISPFWLALEGLVLVALAERRALRSLLTDARVHVALGAIVCCGIVAVAWTVREHATDVFSRVSVPAGVPELTILERSFAHNAFYVPDMVGIFGWFDTHPPLATFVLWYAMVGALLVGGALAATRRQLAVLASFVLAVLVVPVAISSSQAHAVGYVWQGRDTLPFAVGLPVVAASLVARRLAGAADVVCARATAVLAVLAVLAQLAAFFEALRRYAVGVAGPDFAFLLHAPWQPPAGSLALVVAEAVVLVLAGAAAVAAARAPAAGEGARLAASPLLERAGAGAAR
ncbi:MAG TPA: DUF2142 domain-containing protein [Acidimicrobiales bacterium]|nr:DUF2142 domain-containing protein [Acidimicrobiales bacterium]